MALLMTGCTVQIKDPSAPYFPTTPPAESLAALPVTGALSGGPQTSVFGPVSEPNPALTPGAVATSDASTVCAGPVRVNAEVPSYEAAAVFAAYNLAYPHEASNYFIDELVPLTLGGANVEANLWPASSRPIGFHEKQELDSRLRTLVCEGALPLGQVQQELMSNWYTLWLRYG